MSGTQVLAENITISIREEKIYTTASAARFLSVSEGTIKRWGREGKLQCTTTERGVRIYSESTLIAKREELEAKRVAEAAETVKKSESLTS